MRYFILISYLIFISLILPISISHEELTNNELDFDTPKACINSNYPNTNELDNQIAAQTSWSTIGSIINSGLGFTPVFGSISSTLFSIFWNEQSPTIVEQMVRYVNKAIAINLICQNYADALNKFELLKDRMQNLQRCIEKGFPCYQLTKDLEYLNLYQFMRDQKNSFGGPKFIVLFEESKLTLLPLYTQYMNLYLSFLRDQLVTTSYIKWNKTSIDFFEEELTNTSREATKYAYSVYNDALEQFPQDDEVGIYDYNKIAQFIRTYTTGVLLFVDKWIYLNIIKYPFGPPPSKPRSIFSPTVGYVAKHSVPNPLKIVTPNVYPPKVINAHRINYWKECKAFITQKERFKGIGKIHFINDYEPQNLKYGSEIELEYAGGAYCTPLNSFLTSVTVYHGSYIDAVEFGSSIGFTPYGTSGKIDGSFSTDVQKTNFTYPGFFVSGITNFDMARLKPDCRTHVMSGMSFIFTYYGDMIPTRKAIPGLQLHRYIFRQNYGGVIYRLLTTYQGENYEGWRYEGQVWNALSFGFTDFSTAIVYQFYKASEESNRYYYSTNPLFGKGWIFQYPVFNVYTNPLIPDVIPVYEYRQAIITKPVTPARVPEPDFNSIFSTDESLSGWSRIGIAWYTKKPEKKLPTVSIDNAFKYFVNSGFSTQCLTVNHFNSKPIPKLCNEDVNQVWQIETYPSGIQMVNPVCNFALSNNAFSTAAELSRPTAAPDPLSSFEFYSPRDNSFMIKIKHLTLCLQVEFSIPLNTYFIEFLQCDPNNLYQRWIPRNLPSNIIKGINSIPVNLMGCLDSLGYFCSNTLSEGQSLRSQMGSTLYLNSNGYLEIIKSDSSRPWKSNEKPDTPDRPYKAIMQTDGNFVLYGASGKAYFSTGVYSRGSILNFVNLDDIYVQDRSNNIIWTLYINNLR